MPREQKQNFKSIKDIINDSTNQLLCFNTYNDITKIRQVINETNFKTLEEYTGKTKKELEEVEPGICDEYNALIKQLKNKDLTYEQFREIMRKAFAIAQVH